MRPLCRVQMPRVEWDLAHTTTHHLSCLLPPLASAGRSKSAMGQGSKDLGADSNGTI